MPENIRNKKWSTVGFWVLTGLLAAAFIMSGSTKLVGDQAMAAEYQRWGYPLWFMTFIGAAEVLGGLALLVPGLVTIASSGLVVIMVGAIYTHIAGGDGGAFIAPLVLLGLLAFVGFKRRKDAILPKFLSEKGSKISYTTS